MSQTLFETSGYLAATTQIVQDVFESMLNYRVEEAPQNDGSRGVVTAAIFFAGTWKGATLLECSEEQAFCFTARLMQIPEPIHLDNDVRDAMGEIINMIGGNIKAVLPAGAGLSMPSVSEGVDNASRICGAHLKETLSFRGDLGPLWVTLVRALD